METSRSMPLAGLEEDCNGGQDPGTRGDHGHTGSKNSIKAADLLVAALENEGVTHVFGVPGEENLDLVEALRRRSGCIKLVVTRHEESAGFMAATVGRLTGRPGVALSTLGPGATNMCSAAAYAYLGGFPVLLITGQKPVSHNGQSQFQVVNVVNMFAPITKMAKQVTRGSLIPSMVREAARRAAEEKPGPCHLELPEDVASEQVPSNQAVLLQVDRVRRPVAEAKAVARCAEMLRGAQHPVLVVGAAANRKATCRMLRQFLDVVPMYFFDTQMGKGVVAARHQRYLGTAALSDGDYVHEALASADVVIMVGHDVTEKPPIVMDPSDKRRVVHVGYTSAQVDEVYCPHLEVIGDIANTIWQLKQTLTSSVEAGALGGQKQHQQEKEEKKEEKKEAVVHWDNRYFAYIKERFEEHCRWGTAEDEAQGSSLASLPLTPPRLVEAVRAAMPDDGILCLDNGLYKLWMARQYKAYGPNTLLLDNALATMGAGLPSAIAAKLLYPDRTVVALCGDGGLLMTGSELATAVGLGLDLVVLVANDNCLGMIRWKQAAMEFPSYGLDLEGNPDFVAYAEAFGAKGYRPATAEDVAPLLQRCISGGGSNGGGKGKGGVRLVELPVDYSVSDRLQVPVLKEHLSKTLQTPEQFYRQQQQTGGKDAAKGEEKKGKKEKEEGGEMHEERGKEEKAAPSTPDKAQQPRGGAGCGGQGPATRPAAKEQEPKQEAAAQQKKAGAAQGQQAAEAKGGQQSPQQGQGKDKDKGEGAGPKEGGGPPRRAPYEVVEGGEEGEEGADAPPRRLPFYLAGKAAMPNNDLEVTNKYTGKVAYCVPKATRDDVDAAIQAAADAAPAMAALAGYQRREVLEHCVREFGERAEELAQALCTEAGKPIKAAKGEVGRLIETFTIAMEESTRITGEVLPLDIGKRTAGMTALTKQVPVGPVAAVSPFNFPLNLAAHKVAPAIAVGCPFVLKPASRTPVGALIIGEVLSTAPHLPPGCFSVLPCGREAADLLVTDDKRLRLLTFTGSADVGWDMKARVGRKACVLELGGNAACVVEDYPDGGLDGIVKKLVHGGYYQSGQSCISLQRLFVRQDLYDDVRSAMTQAVEELVVGNPKQEDVFVGPLISEKAAEKVEEWVNEAVDKGARVLAGGKREGAIMYPTLLEKVPSSCRVVREEVFGPVVVMEPYYTYEEALKKVNDSRYGLQAGVFTRDLDKAWAAFNRLEVGGVAINRPPSLRSDAQPYGGVKDSGLGREGVRYAMRDMTETRALLLSDVGVA